MVETIETVMSYISGFFDGEGTIHIDTKYRLHVKVRNTYLPVLIDIQRILGGKIYNVPLDKNEERRLSKKLQYEWSVRSNDALITLKKIEPYLKVKKIQAVVAIKFQEERKDYRGGYYNLGIPKYEEQKYEWYRKELIRLKDEDVPINELNKYIKLIEEQNNNQEIDEKQTILQF